MSGVSLEERGSWLLLTSSTGVPTWRHAEEEAEGGMLQPQAKGLPKLATNHHKLGREKEGMPMVSLLGARPSLEVGLIMRQKWDTSVVLSH